MDVANVFCEKKSAVSVGVWSPRRRVGGVARGSVDVHVSVPSGRMRIGNC